MPLAAERILRTAMREKSFARVYYFFGDDDFLKESTAREFLTAVVETSTRDFNYDVLRGPEVTAQALDTALSTPPMMAARRAVVVRDVHALSGDARRALDVYMQHPAADTVLLLIAPSGEKPDPALVANTFALAFLPLSADRVARWIAHHASTALGVQVTPGAVPLLQDAVGTDLAQLATELDKLASYMGGQPITEETVREVVGIRHGESLGDLLDAVAERDAPRAVALVPQILAQARITVVAVVMALTTQTLAIGWGGAVGEQSARGKLEREFFTLLRESRVYPGRTWGEAVRAWTRAASRWSPWAVDDALAQLLAADRAAKETRLASDEQLLTALVLGVCTAGERAAA